MSVNKTPKLEAIVGSLFGNPLKAWHTPFCSVAACIVLGKYVVTITYSSPKLTDIKGFEIFKYTDPSMPSNTLCREDTSKLEMRTINHIIPMIERKLVELSPELRGNA